MLKGNLPQHLDQIYENVLSFILQNGPTARDIAMKVFSWLLYMFEPLTPSALVSAITTTSNDHGLHLAQLIEICGNMIVHDTKLSSIRFAHRSFEDFLKGRDSFKPDKAHEVLGIACLEACIAGPSQDYKLQYPSEHFYGYAMMYWPVHLGSQLSDKPDNSHANIQRISTFVFSEDLDTSLSFDMWLDNVNEIAEHLPNDHRLKTALCAIPRGDPAVLFLASVFGLTGLFDIISPAVADLYLEQRSELGHTLLYLACAFGHKTMVSRLLARNVKADIECGRYGSALHAACFAGHVEIAKSLLQYGAISTCGSLFDDAFQASFRGARQDVAQALIKNGNMITTSEEYDRAVDGASQVGFLDVIKDLQQKFPSFASKRKMDKTKLRNAIEIGDGNLQKFLSKKAKPLDFLPSDAISLAVLYGHKDLVVFLIKQGADIEVPGTFGSPLQTAALINHKPITQLLLDHGANINGNSITGNALHVASMKGYATLVKYLIDQGANVNQKGGFYGNPLQAAAYCGHADIVNLLLDAGANVHTRGYSQDAFHAAAEGGHQDILLLMLRRGFRSYFAERKLMKPLASMQQPPTSIALPTRFKTLLRRASQEQLRPTYKARKQQKTQSATAKIIASAAIDLETVFRLANNVHVKNQPVAEAPRCYNDDSLRDRLLEAGAEAGQVEVVRVLLGQKQDLGIPDLEIDEAVKLAASKGHLEVVKLLIHHVATYRPIESFVAGVVVAAQKQQPNPVIDYAMSLAVKHCSKVKMVEISKTLQLVDSRIRTNSPLSTPAEELMDACDSGSIDRIVPILSSHHNHHLSETAITRAVQLCASQGHSQLLTLLLDSLILKNGNGIYEGAIIAAAANGHVDVVELLAKSPDVDTTPASRPLGLGFAAAMQYGHIDLMRYLVEKFAIDLNVLVPDVHIKKDYSSTHGRQSPGCESNSAKPSSISHLQAALGRHRDTGQHVRYNYRSLNRPSNLDLDSGPDLADKSLRIETVTFLLEHGADPNNLGGMGLYPIQVAAREHPGILVERLIAAGAKADVKGKGSESALLLAAKRELDASSIVNTLLRAGAKLPTEEKQMTELIGRPLSFFSLRGSSYTSKSCLATAQPLEYIFQEGPGAVLHTLLSLFPRHKPAFDDEYTTALHLAAVSNQQSLVKLLLKRGADVNKKGFYYGTMLQAASRWGHVNMVMTLLEAGANIHAVGGRWGTALRGAIAGRHLEVIRILVNRDVGKEALTSALQLSVQSGELCIVQVILEAGADTSHGEPLILGAWKGYFEIVRALLDAGTPVNASWKAARDSLPVSASPSPLCAAVLGGHWEVAEMLLVRGASIEVDTDYETETPMILAAKGGMSKG